MQLTKRLERIAKYVPINSVVADVGTDHGYIPIYLASNNRVSKAYAIDINKGPLKKAESNIKAHGVEDKVTTILSDGLKNFDKEVDTIIIAGMGGMLISKILEDSKNKLENVNKLILSPHLDDESVRIKVHQLNYKIINEELLFEDGKYYPIIICEKGKEKYNNPKYYKYGKILIEKKDATLKQLLDKKLNTNENIIKAINKQNSNSASIRIKELDKEVKEIEEVISWL